MPEGFLLYAAFANEQHNKLMVLMTFVHIKKFLLQATFILYFYNQQLTAD
jgi:hypothetical protein